MRFVCAFAWADLEIADSETHYITRLMEKLDLDDEARGEVRGWLQLPPRPEEVDPGDIPPELKQIFLTIILEVVGADGVVDEREVENLSLLEQLLR